MWQRGKNTYHLLMAVLANSVHQFPSRKLKVIGVTGTDGKTTTVNLIYHIMHEAGLSVAMVSTIHVIIADKTYDTGFHVTTPSSFALQRFIRQAATHSEYLVLEVTSHSIDQHRVWGIPFAIGVLTNVTHEHLDYHKTYEQYLGVKAKLLQRAKTVVLNRDDGSFESINKKLATQNAKVMGQKVITYGLKDNADVNTDHFLFETKLLGAFNKYNILASVAVCQELGIADDVIRKAIASFAPPAGRQEVVYDKDFQVMIDFAHTPNAFTMLLPEIKKMMSGRLIHVFGAPAKRDVTKRPMMGKISSEYADVMILTAEDPRGESVEAINKEIRKEIFNFQFSIFNKNNSFQFEKGKKYLFEILDRKEAIEAAIGMTRKGDVVVITGKGHEKSMNYNGHEEPWSDQEAVEEALKMTNS